MVMLQVLPKGGSLSGLRTRKVYCLSATGLQKTQLRKVAWNSYAYGAAESPGKEKKGVPLTQKHHLYLAGRGVSRLNSHRGGVQVAQDMSGNTTMREIIRYTKLSQEEKGR
jgi:hypothetical protein